MKKIDHYIQEKGIISKLHEYVDYENIAILVGTFQFEKYKRVFLQELKGEVFLFDDVCSETNILKLADICKEKKFDAIFGFGGGKTLDVAKACAYYADLPLIIMPSSASMDGACSALSVLYNEDGGIARYLYLPNHPNSVFVDSEILFDSPLSLFASGMADALSSYYETYEYAKNHEVSDEVMNYANHCKQLLDMYYVFCVDYEARELSEDVESVIKTILYDSCIAFENTNTGSAHVFANATTFIPQSKGSHGERVALGILIYLLYEQIDMKEYKTFLKVMKLPLCLKDLNILEKDIFYLVDVMCENSDYQKDRLLKVMHKVNSKLPTSKMIRLWIMIFRISAFIFLFSFFIISLMNIDVSLILIGISSILMILSYIMGKRYTYDIKEEFFNFIEQI